MLLRVDLDVGHARDGRRDVGQGPAGGAARSAEGGGELQQGRARRLPVVRRPDQHAAPRWSCGAGTRSTSASPWSTWSLRWRGPETAAADSMGPRNRPSDTAPSAERKRAHDSDQQHPPTEVHVPLNLRTARLIPRPRPVLGLRDAHRGARGGRDRRDHRRAPAPGGADVALIARGAHGAAIRERGLTFATPQGGSRCASRCTATRPRSRGRRTTWWCSRPRARTPRRRPGTRDGGRAGVPSSQRRTGWPTNAPWRAGSPTCTGSA